MTLAPLFATVAGLLIVSGASKLRAPQAAERALAAMSLPGTGPLVRIAGACELALGAFALLHPSLLAAALVAAAYLGFAVFVAGLLRSGGGRAGGGGRVRGGGTDGGGGGPPPPHPPPSALAAAHAPAPRPPVV